MTVDQCRMYELSNIYIVLKRLTVLGPEIRAKNLNKITSIDPSI